MKVISFSSIIISAWFMLALLACSDILPPAPDDEAVLAGPLEGLTGDQIKTHIDGDESFGRIFGAADGLGPIFVNNSCESCHVGDGKGHPLNNLTRFGRYSSGQWDPMVSHGGPQLQHRAISGYPAETVPDSATGITGLTPPSVTGLGFLEAVNDLTLLDMADPDDSDGDGISGRVNLVTPPDFFVPAPGQYSDGGKYIGRFGKKAGAINLLHQTVNAYKQDMGITSDFDPVDLFNPNAGNQSGDTVTDPEVSASEVHNVVFYVRTLKAPPRRDSDDPSIVAGQVVFEQIGCAACHVPELATGHSDIASLSRKTFYPYTDLLLHDMGPDLNDGYQEGDAQPAEWRTAPLWGIGLAEDSQGGSPYYLHDGRARTLEEAILYHGGEAASSRTSFEELSSTEKEQLIAFLTSL